MPLASFQYGFYNATNETAFYQELLLNPAAEWTLIFALDYPGLGLPQAMYYTYSRMTSNITS